MGIFEKPIIQIELAEYRQLIRDCEKLSVLKDYMTSDGYKTTETVAMILGVKEGGTGDGNTL